MKENEVFNEELMKEQALIKQIKADEKRLKVDLEDTRNNMKNLQRAIIGVKSHWIKDLFISLKIFWNLNV